MRSLLATLLMTLAASAVSAKPSEGERFNAWLDATWEETLVRRPILATSIGDSRYNDRIIDFTTAAWRADNRRFLERQFRELKGFDRKALVGQAGDKAGVHGFRVIGHVLKDLGLPTPPVGTKSAGMVEHLRAHVTYPRLETFLRGCDAYKLEPEEPMESGDGVPF